MGFIGVADNPKGSVAVGRRVRDSLPRRRFGLAIRFMHRRPLPPVAADLRISARPQPSPAFRPPIVKHSILLWTTDATPRDKAGLARGPLGSTDLSDRSCVRITAPVWARNVRRLQRAWLPEDTARHRSMTGHPPPSCHLTGPVSNLCSGYLPPPVRRRRWNWWATWSLRNPSRLGCSERPFVTPCR